jgi:hypothetical protein
VSGRRALAGGGSGEVRDRMAEPAPSPWWRPLALPLLASLTLGLAPYVPEPHVVGKLRWVLGGAHGMTAVDWGDLVMHGAPWVWLAGAAVLVGVRRQAARR